MKEIELYNREKKRLNRIKRKYQTLYENEYNKLMKKIYLSRLLGKKPYEKEIKRNKST